MDGIQGSAVVVEAFAVMNGRFVDVGSNEQILQKHPNAMVRELSEVNYQFDYH
jgi:hypothetical protein